MSKNEKQDIVLLIQKLDSKIDLISSEFQSKLDQIQANLIFKLSSVIIVIVSIAFIAIAWMFDYRLDFTNEQNQAHFEKLDAAVFISQNEAILKAIQNLQTKQIDHSEKDIREIKNKNPKQNIKIKQKR